MQKSNSGVDVKQSIYQSDISGAQKNENRSNDFYRKHLKVENGWESAQVIPIL